MIRSLLFRWLSQTPATSKRGEAGERVAERYLRREKGFKRIARNWRNPQDRREEIDLVMKDGEVLVFVEVKTRAMDALVPDTTRWMRPNVRFYVGALRRIYAVCRLSRSRIGSMWWRWAGRRRAVRSRPNCVTLSGWRSSHPVEAEPVLGRSPSARNRPNRPSALLHRAGRV